MPIQHSNVASSVLLTFGLLAAGATAAGFHNSPASAAEPAPAGRQAAGGALSAAEFDALHGRLTRMAGERVWSIPWRLSVREAREAAARENKPIFLWISNNGGTHPLGPC